MKYIIDKSLNLKNDAGFKARIDVIDIAQKQGYKYIPLQINNYNLYDKIKIFLKLINLKFEYCSTIIIQYPLNNSVIKRVLKKAEKNNCKTICIIHDVESLRMLQEKELINKEIEFFNSFNIVISHNKFMSEWLVSHGCNSKIIEIKLFDYIAKKREIDNISNDSYRISYATGVLGSEKSKFLDCCKEIVDNNCKFILYGNIDKKLEEKILVNNNIEYKGALPPDKIVSQIEGNFGLVWDSSVINECDGMFGNYTRYNNPHKLSMYIAAELPVIVWDKCAIAEFVIENNIGICVSNLSDLKYILRKLKSEEYEIMKKNILKISNSIRNGKYTEEVLRNIESLLN